MVLRRSTTDWACEMAFTRAARSIENFMVNPYVVPARIGRGPAGRQFGTNRRGVKLSDSGLQQAAQQVDILSQAVVGVAQLFDLLHAMHDGGVIAAAEAAPDLG